MPDTCIFCDNIAGSGEHLWPEWVHSFIRQNGIELVGFRTQIANGPEIIEDDLEKKIDTVCRTCNNTWMSQIEQKNRPRFLKMLKNEPLTLDGGGMKIIMEWAVLKSMILDRPHTTANEYMQKSPKSVQQMVGTVYSMLTTTAMQQQANAGMSR